MCTFKKLQDAPYFMVSPVSLWFVSELMQRQNKSRNISHIKSRQNTINGGGGNLPNILTLIIDNSKIIKYT